MDTGIVIRFELERMDDPNRLAARADLAAPGEPPTTGVVEASVKLNIWTGDNPSLKVIQLRILDAVSRAFVLSDALRSSIVVADETKSIVPEGYVKGSIITP